LIDEATMYERDRAWLPPTNDHNEGLLGEYRVAMRRQPQLTLLQFNAVSMFHRNETSAFMETMFLPEDYQYIHKLAGNSDELRLERDRKQERIQIAKEKIDLKVVRSEKRKQKKTERANRVAEVQLVMEKDVVTKMKGQELKDHFQAFKLAGAPIPKEITIYSKVAFIKEALVQAIDGFLGGKWALIASQNDASDTGGSSSYEEFDLEKDIEGDWDDEDD
jgi:hypothetical protein